MKKPVERIVVTGGAGYLGCEVVRTLAAQYPESRIVVVDNLSRGRLEAIGVVAAMVGGERVEIVPAEQADIRDYENMRQLFERVRPDACVHLAAIVDAVNTNRPGRDRETECVNHEAAVELARTAKAAGVQAFVYQSTVSMYSRGEELTELAERGPLSTYGRSKLEAELAILPLAGEGFDTVGLRSATFVGYTPGFAYQTIVNLACVRSIYDVPIRVFESALDGYKTYLDVKDQARAIVFAIDNSEGMSGQPFNVTSFHARLRDVLSILEESLGKKIRIHIVGERAINQQVYTINSDKLKALGFRPTGELRTVLTETLAALQAHRELELRMIASGDQGR